MTPIRTVKLKPRRPKKGPIVDLDSAAEDVSAQNMIAVEVVLGSTSSKRAAIAYDNVPDLNKTTSTESPTSIAIDKRKSFRSRFMKQTMAKPNQVDPEALQQSEIKQLALSPVDTKKSKRSKHKIKVVRKDQVQDQADSHGGSPPRNQSGTDAPVSVVLGRRSNVSELTAPKMPRRRSLDEESIAELRRAISKVQHELDGAKQGKKTSRESVMKTLIGLADTLESRGDHETMRRELSRISSADHQSSSLSASSESSTLNEEHGTKLGKHQNANDFSDGEDSSCYSSDGRTGDYTGHDDDDDNSSFSRWLEDIEQKKEKRGFFDFLGLLGFWFNESDLEEEWSEFKADGGRSSGQDKISTPPRIKKVTDSSNSKVLDVARRSRMLQTVPEEQKPSQRKRDDECAWREQKAAARRRKEIQEEEQMMRELEEEDQKIREAQKAKRARKRESDKKEQKRNANEMEKHATQRDDREDVEHTNKVIDFQEHGRKVEEVIEFRKEEELDEDARAKRRIAAERRQMLEQGESIRRAIQEEMRRQERAEEERLKRKVNESVRPVDIEVQRDAPGGRSPDESVRLRKADPEGILVTAKSSEDCESGITPCSSKSYSSRRRQSIRSRSRGSLSEISPAVETFVLSRSFSPVMDEDEDEDALSVGSIESHQFKKGTGSLLKENVRLKEPKVRYTLRG